MKRRSLPSGQDERKTCLAEGTARAEALRHGRMRCMWGTEGDVAGSLSIDGKLQRKERWKSAGDRHGRSGAIVRSSDFILQATGRVFRRDVICSIQLLPHSRRHRGALGSSQDFPSGDAAMLVALTLCKVSNNSLNPLHHPERNRQVKELPEVTQWGNCKSWILDLSVCS